MRATSATSVRGLLGAAALIALAAWTGSASVAPAQEPVPADHRERLDAIREDLVGMRFDRALAAIDAFLGQGGLDPTVRGEALVLRAQAHAAFGDFAAAEADYREILPLRPGYAPDPGLTPAKAMTRFEKVRAELVGRIRPLLDPADATLRVDGQPRTADADGALFVLAGTHTLRAERRGHDPLEQVVEVAANREVEVTLALVPNARTIVLRTDQEGVEVRLDGRPVGRTERTAATGAAQLVIEDVPLGEHVYELSRECFRTERLSDTLAVDLLDRAPKRYQLVRMAPVRSRLRLRGGPEGAEVRVDGRASAHLPAEPIEICPGMRVVAVVVRGRVVWRTTVELQESREEALEVVPRPNAVVVGADGWPRGLEQLGAAFNFVAFDAPAGERDLGSAEQWGKIGIPAGIDLALGVEPSSRPGAAERWYLYSPILREAVRIEAAPALAERPRWSVVSWGFATVDTEAAGPARVVAVVPGGPAAAIGLAVGDRVVEVAGRAVEDSAAIRVTLREARPDLPVRIAWVRAGLSETIAGELIGRVGPSVLARDEGLDVAIVRAAWAELDAGVAQGVAASTARANLGLLFLRYGHAELAVDLWRRVEWGDRAGVGEGTRQYYLGRALEALGREEEAVRAYRAAAASRATAFTDDGPPIALAARDRLADLGVAAD